MDYRDRHVVVTGGTGALGTAMVGALTEAGAICHVPYINPAEADRFAFRNHPQVKLVADIELTQEAAVRIALLNNRRLRATLEDLGISEAELLGASAEGGVIAARIGEGGNEHIFQHGALREEVVELEFEDLGEIGEASRLRCNSILSLCFVPLC